MKKSFSLSILLIINNNLIFNYGTHLLSDNQIIKFINDNNFTWKAEKNKFNYWSLDSLKKLTGILNYKMDNLNRFEKKVHKHLASIPSEFDSRENWPKCETIQEIRDQGMCGSCWSVATVEVISDRICIFSNGRKKPHISAQNLLSCCIKCGFGCEGGYTEEAWIWYVEKGIVTGGNYKSRQGCQPYSIPDCGVRDKFDPICEKEAKTPRCSRICQRDYNIPYNQDKFFGKKAYSIENDEIQIQTEIMLNGPVEATYMLYEDFLYYKEGVYFHTAGVELGGHAVKIIGWGVENSVKYWLVANSWNIDWGLNGFFKISRGFNECGIEAGILAGTPSEEW